jgi:hypothetical protein
MRRMGDLRVGEYAKHFRRIAVSPFLTPFLLAPFLLLAACELGLPTEEEQSGSGAISGTITDSTNTMVPNASIAVRGAATRNVVAAAGVYSINELPAGGYTVTIIPPQGWGVAPNTNGTVPLQIVASETKTVNFRLRRSQ